MNSFQFTDHMLGRICDQLMGVQGWRPAIDDDERDAVLATLGSCDSHLERMYVLGAVHRLEFLAMGRVPLMPATVRFSGQLRGALQLGGAWHGFKCARCQREGGPWGLILVPQFPLRGRSWDFGIFSGLGWELHTDDQLIGLVQVDGYAVHRDRRRVDAAIRRDASQAGVPVFAVYEESHRPSFWFDAVIHEWWRRRGDVEPGCPAAKTCDVLLPEPMEAA